MGYKWVSTDIKYGKGMDFVYLCHVVKSEMCTGSDTALVKIGINEMIPEGK